MTGVLVLAGTPIGDRDDASPSLRRALLEADVIAAEDTREFRTLLARLGLVVEARVVSYFEGNEEARTPALVDDLRAGQRVVLVTDAGMPSVSDPGYVLVRAAIAAGIRVTAVPGPSAVLTAVAVSGLGVDRFCFEGFLPRKGGPRQARLAELAREPRTMVFFEAPHRLAEFLADAAAVLGPGRAACVCRELTKRHEEVVRGTLADLAVWATEGARGEITVVVEGASADAGSGLDAAVGEVQARVDAGASFKDAVAEVAAGSSIARKALYEAALAARHPAPPSPLQ